MEIWKSLRHTIPSKGVLEMSNHPLQVRQLEAAQLLFALPEAGPGDVSTCYTFDGDFKAWQVERWWEWLSEGPQRGLEGRRIVLIIW